MGEVFKILNAINVNENTEKKNGLTYLSWAWAWAELKKVYPDATYQIRHFEGRPYLYDANLGYMVMTEITIDGITHEMWLPVMDGANKAMKDEPYTYRVKNPSFKYAKLNKNDGKYYDSYGKEQTEYIEKEVAAATMFDINTAIMRCLTKNIAMFGLGLYIYAGEDLPEESEESKEESKKKAEEKKKEAELEKEAADIAKMKIAPVKVQLMKKKCADDGISKEKVLKLYKIKSFEDMTENQFRNASDHWQEIKEMK